MFEKKSAFAFAIGDRFEWGGTIYRIIGMWLTTYNTHLIQIATAERPLKPFTFTDTQILNVAR